MPRKPIQQQPEDYYSYMVDPNTTIRNSPFGTTHTSKLRYRIVGSKLMPVVEDNVYPQPLTGREIYDARSRPMAEKPNHVWPSNVQPPFAQEDPFMRNSMNSEKYYNTLSHVSKPQNDPLHPYSVLPPVRTSPDYPNPHSDEIRQQDPNEVLNELSRRLPGTRLPNEPIHFSPIEISLLMQRMHYELAGYPSQRLKDIYVEMTTFDRRLSGLIHFDDFIFATRKHQLKSDPMLLRLVASMFVVPQTPNFVNYEKILSFIGASLRSDQPPSPVQVAPVQTLNQSQIDRRPVERIPQVDPHAGWDSTPRSIGLKTANRHEESGREQVQPTQPPPIGSMPGQSTHDSRPEQLSPRQQPQQQYRPIETREQKKNLPVEGNQAKLLSILNDALKGYSREDFNRLVDAFYLWDREKKGSLTVDDIKTVAYRQNLRITNSIMNALLDMCYVKWDQYDWRKFVKYIEAGLPAMEEIVRPVENTMRVREEVKEPVPAPSVHYVTSTNTEIAPMKPPQHSPRGTGAISPSSEARAWFDRFMRLSKALYTVDSKYVGHLPPDDIRWVTNEYNRVYELGLNDEDVDEAINVSITHSGMVNIDSYLRSLSLRGNH